eukprot:scaffold11145_cov104-Skeletonema_marinoi.AAC.5
MPVHKICDNRDVDETTAIEILKLLIEKYPEAVQQIGGIGNHLPIHLASIQHSPEFCRVLIEAYPGSERITDASGELPLHFACWNNTVATVEYLHTMYPDAVINHTSASDPPIASAVMGVKDRLNPTAAVEIVKFLLDCDPSVALQEFEGMTLLHFACQRNYNDSKIETGIQIIKAMLTLKQLKKTKLLPIFNNITNEYKHSSTPN